MKNYRTELRQSRDRFSDNGCVSRWALGGVAMAKYEEGVISPTPNIYVVYLVVSSRLAGGQIPQPLLEYAQ